MYDDGESEVGTGNELITVVIGADDGYDATTGTTQITLDDGTIDITFGSPKPSRKDSQFNDNLAELMGDDDLSVVAEKLLLGIEQDIQSRSEWMENMSNGISLLGLQIKNPRGASASGSTPAEGVSTVDHPLLLEAVLRFQANALGELLPTDGPVKVRNDGEGNELAERLAGELQKDLNHYLTKVAKEYFPDTDRMLLMLGFSGISFKKGFHDPIKRRPVIISIDAKDLIVSNTASDLDGAIRVTHRIMMRPSMMRRMQLVGAYRDIALPGQMPPNQKNPVDTKIDQVQGIAPPTYVEPSDADRELYECYCETEIPGFEHTLKDKKSGEEKQTGLPLPYKIVVDKESRRILEIRRNWDESDPFCLALNRIIAYTFIPGLGFYGIGLLNILGNATKAVTAAWRLMIDAGMFANFPGFLYLKSLAKQLTNQFRIPPGGGMPIDTMGTDIRQSVMPLPYKEASAVFIQLIENIATTAQRVGGTAEIQIGEGKQDAPVGTTLAMLEQATKLMSAVHKRMHYAHSQELDLLKSLLMEDPEALWRHNKKSRVLKLLTKMAGQAPVVDAENQAEDRHRALFLAALSDCELLPASDPNTSSQTERYLKVVASRQMAMTNPSIDLNKVDLRAFRIMGFDDAESMFKPPPSPNAPPPPPDPETITAQATLMAAQARIADSQTKSRDAAIKAQADQLALASKEKIASLGVAREMIIHQSNQDARREAQGVENQSAAADRVHKLALANLASRNSRRIAADNNAHTAAEGVMDRKHEMLSEILARHHEAAQNELDRQGKLGVAPQ